MISDFLALLCYGWGVVVTYLLWVWEGHVDGSGIEHF